MRQVPHYLIIGNGRVAKHFRHYFSLSSIGFSTWQRSEDIALLNLKLIKATHVLLLISDSAIEDFAQTYLQHTNAICIHFSGSVISDKVYGAHPLMTFSTELYSLDIYQDIPFIIDANAPDFQMLLPGLANKHARLNTADKNKYHALCVLSGNLSCYVWQKLFAEFENTFHFPSDIAHAYLKQQTQNLLTHPKEALTGPVTRGDQVTIEKNIAALENNSLQLIYKSFIESYQS